MAKNSRKKYIVIGCFVVMAVVAIVVSVTLLAGCNQRVKNEEPVPVDLGAKHGIMTNNICFDKVVADGDDLFYVQSSGFREINRLALENHESGETTILASAKKAGMHIKYVNDEWIYYSETRTKSNGDVRRKNVFRINRATGAKEAVDIPGYKSNEPRGEFSQLNFVGDSVLFVESRAEGMILHIYNLVSGENHEKKIDLSGNANLKDIDLSKLMIRGSACDGEYLCFGIECSRREENLEVPRDGFTSYFAIVNLNDGNYAATIREDVRVLDDTWNYRDERYLAIQDGYAYFMHMEDSVYLPSWNETESIYEKHLSRILLTENDSVPELLVKEKDDVSGFNLTEKELYYTVSESRKNAVTPVVSVKKMNPDASSKSSVIFCMESMGMDLIPFVYKGCVYGTYMSGVATEMVDLLRIKESDGFGKYLVSDDYKAVPDGWPLDDIDTKTHIRSFKKGFHVRKMS